MTEGFIVFGGEISISLFSENTLFAGRGCCLRVARILLHLALGL